MRLKSRELLPFLRWKEKNIHSHAQFFPTPFPCPSGSGICFFLTKKSENFPAAFGIYQSKLAAIYPVGFRYLFFLLLSAFMRPKLHRFIQPGLRIVFPDVKKWSNSIGYIVLKLLTKPTKNVSEYLNVLFIIWGQKAKNWFTFCFGKDRRGLRWALYRQHVTNTVFLEGWFFIMNTGRCSVERVKSKKKGTHFRHFSLSNKNLSKPNTQKGTEDFVQSKTKLEANRPCWSYLCVWWGRGGRVLLFFYLDVFSFAFSFFSRFRDHFFFAICKRDCKKNKKRGVSKLYKTP